MNCQHSHTHWLLRSRDGLYYSGTGWGIRTYAKRYRFRPNLELLERCSDTPIKDLAKAVKVKVYRKKTP